MKLTQDVLMSKEGFRLLGNLFNSSSEGIMFFDIKGKVTMTNPRALEIFGYKEEELLGLPVESLIPMELSEIHKNHRNNYLLFKPRRYAVCSLVIKASSACKRRFF